MLKYLYQRLRHQIPLIVITLLITFCFLVERFGIYDWPILDHAESFLYDLRVVATMPNEVDKRIVIVDIDEKSLSEIGRWPWSRNNITRLINELFDNYEVRLTGFDVVFAEPDESSGLNILKALGKNELSEVTEYHAIIDTIEDELNYDLQLSKSISKHNVILGYYFKHGKKLGQVADAGELPEPAFNKDIFEGKDVFAHRASGYGGNIKILQNAAKSAGHFSPWIDDDGAVRRVPMLYEYKNNYYEALSLVMFKKLFDVKNTTPTFDLGNNTGYPSLETLSLEYIDIPVDKHVRALVPYRGYQGSFPYVSATDVINGRVDKTILQDTIVLVGTSAPGLYDLRTTPVQKQYAGVEIHANLLSGMLDQTIKLSPDYVHGVEIVQLLLIGILLSILLPLLSPIWATFTTLVFSILIIIINICFWQFGNLVLPLSTSLLVIGIIFIVNMSYGFFIERRSKLQIASTFGQYIPPELVEEMNFNPGSYSLNAENREMTVLFSDIRGFTTISEGLPPEQLSQLMNAYLTPMTKIIHEKRGTIDKYMGDAIMAFWGAPVENKEHARYALDAAMTMLKRLNAIRVVFLDRGWPAINIGIGLNTGTMSVGNMGSEFRMAYTVIGDAVNLGSRLEGLTKSYAVEIIVSETTKQTVPGYVYRELDFVKVKGKDKPIAIYEPISPKEEISSAEKDEIKQWHQALKAYRQQNWAKSNLLLQQLKLLAPDRKLYDIYLERIFEFMENPPGSEWDGVYVHLTK